MVNTRSRAVRGLSRALSYAPGSEAATDHPTPSHGGPAMPSSDLAALYKQIHTLSLNELDALPYGAIQLNKEGTIVKYNKFESTMAGVAKESAIGKNFFREVAPCTDVKAFHGRFKEGIARKKLHEKFRYHFPFKDKPRNVLITLFYHAESDHVWVFVQPLE
jgi:photoactive yellow protein